MGTSSTNIRKMTEQDIANIVELEKVSFQTPWSEISLRKEFESFNSFYLIIEKKSDLIGYIGSHIILDEVDIHNIAIFPNEKRKGYGYLLLENFLLRLKDINIKQVTLEVRGSNKAAIQLYLKLGFVQIGKRIKYYSDNNEDALVMGVRFDER